MIELSEQQMQALENPAGAPPRMVHPRSKEMFVLLRVDEYERLKQDLARRYPTDRDAYTSGKTEFVASALGRHGG